MTKLRETLAPCVRSNAIHESLRTRALLVYWLLMTGALETLWTEHASRFRSESITSELLAHTLLEQGAHVNGGDHPDGRCLYQAGIGCVGKSATVSNSQFNRSVHHRVKCQIISRFRACLECLRFSTSAVINDIR